MARCRGTTRSGARCRREAGESGYCYQHEDQAGPEQDGQPWEDVLDDGLKVALGVGLLAAILFLPIPFLRRRR